MSTETGLQMNTIDLLMGAGPIVKLVLLLLVGASIQSWTIIFRKFKELKDIQSSNKNFYNVFTHSKDLNGLISRANGLGPSMLGHVFQQGCEELYRYQEKFGQQDYQKRLGEHFYYFGLEGIQRSLRKGINDVQEKMENGLSTLASIGAITPFVGLFGTVWGIMDSFTGLSQGGGSLEVVAPGIAEALIATAVGLAAAIPAVLFYNYLGRTNQKVLTELDSFEKEFLNLVERTFSKG